uniref:Receptor expression-enhancing protein n=2 Tax=Meloidogyne TaxID=189290 RepID=A0A915NI85_9BILA
MTAASPQVRARRGRSTTTARSSSRSRLRPAANEKAKVRRIRSRPCEIQGFRDLRPVLLESLHSKDAFFIPLESVTGLDREQIFYIGFAIMILYLILGNFAGILCNMIGFAYPAYQSVLAIHSTGKDDDTQWLVYWTTFAFFSVPDQFAWQIYFYFPLYWAMKAVFLLYLALPQTYGAHNLYAKYVDPTFEAVSKSSLMRQEILNANVADDDE